MSKDPRFNFYSADFLTGTMFMTNEQVGMYIRLLCVMHQKGRLTKNQMVSVCGKEDAEVFSNFQEEDGKFFNERLETEVRKSQEHSQKQRENVMKRWDKKDTKGIPKKYGGNTNVNTAVIPLENENENENENREMRNEKIKVSVLTFDEFWDLYDKKVDKARCEKRYAKISEDDRQKIVRHVPKYKKAEPRKQFRKNPYTYLYNESYNNEIIQNGHQKVRTNFDFTDKHLQPRG